ncbi:hypothetical protein J3454_09695 [Erythrobacter sp. NFXS35]|uniref:hypothetical protein n=1 Tax=Erythrobacter sp. NFXS35 TaxID=2818436 RepID=UPI0032E03352
MTPPKWTMIALAAAGLGMVAPAMAQNNDWAMQREQQRQANMAERVSAEEMLDGDISNGFNPIASVDDLILSPDGRQVQYVLFDQRGLYFPLNSGNGFVEWSNVDVRPGFGFDPELVVSDVESGKEPQEIALTRSQANRRMVSNLLDSSLTFTDGRTLPVSDILFHPDTGMLSDYVVQMNADSLFDDDQRRVPASMVTVDANGGLRVNQPTNYRYEVWVL